MSENKQNESLRTPDPCAIVVFGATGDLTKRKLLPALYNLAAASLLPEQFALVAYAFSPESEDSFKDELTSSVIQPIQDVWQALPPRFPNYPAGTWAPRQLRV
jgi:glucose-6-phosphate 1-dehydrogenase